MPRFFITKDAVEQKENGKKVITITGSDAHHIAYSLRMAAGESVTVCDMQKNEYKCAISSVAPDLVRADVVSESPSDTEPPYRAYLYQALTKGDKMETIIQKAVETGVFEIIPMVTERCIVKLTGDFADKKIPRWQKIAEEAAKQCGRGIIPAVRQPVTFAKAMQLIKENGGIPLFCYEGDGTKPLSDVLRNFAPHGDELSVSIVIGPEGGFGNSEAETAQNADMIMTGLGKRILRTETASSFALSCLVYEFEK
jgi:RNA methyltransferase, RsmE family